MIVYISDPQNSTRELLNMINSFSEVAGYKINSSQWPFSTQRMNRLRKKLGKQHPSNIHKKYKMPCCDSKEVKDLYDKNFKSLKKEIKDLRRWKDFPCSWIDRLNRVKWLSCQKQSTDSMQSPSKFQCNSS